MRSFSSAEINLFRTMPQGRTKLLLMMGIYSGFRISELLSLTVGDIYENGSVKRTITVKKEHMKGKKFARTVPTHALLKEVIPQLVPHHMVSQLPLFPSRQGKANHQRLSRRQAARDIRHYCDLYGITGNIGTHSMRKSFAMHLYKASQYNILGVCRALGHKDVKTTMKYLEVSIDEIAGWMEKM
jgi:integrase